VRTLKAGLGAVSSDAEKYDSSWDEPSSRSKPWVEVKVGLPPPVPVPLGLVLLPERLLVSARVLERALASGRLALELAALPVLRPALELVPRPPAWASCPPSS